MDPLLSTLVFRVLSVGSVQCKSMFMPTEIRLFIWNLVLEDLPREIIVSRNGSGRLQVKSKKRVGIQGPREEPGTQALAVLQLNWETRDEVAELTQACIILDLSQLDSVDAIMCLKSLPKLSLKLVEDAIIRMTPRDPQYSSLYVERLVAEKLQLRRLIYVTEACAWYASEPFSKRKYLNNLCDFSGWSEQLPFHSLILEGHIKEGRLYITCNSRMKSVDNVRQSLRSYWPSIMTAECGFAALRLCKKVFHPYMYRNQHDDMKYDVLQRTGRYHSI